MKVLYRGYNWKSGKIGVVDKNVRSFVVDEVLCGGQEKDVKAVPLERSPEVILGVVASLIDALLARGVLKAEDFVDLFGNGDTIIYSVVDDNVDTSRFQPPHRDEDD